MSVVKRQVAIRPIGVEQVCVRRRVPIRETDLFGKVEVAVLLRADAVCHRIATYRTHGFGIVFHGAWIDDVVDGTECVEWITILIGIDGVHDSQPLDISTRASIVGIFCLKLDDDGTSAKVPRLLLGEYDVFHVELVTYTDRTRSIVQYGRL